MSVIRPDRVDLGPIFTHRFRLDDIERVCKLVGHLRDEVLKVSVAP